MADSSSGDASSDCSVKSDEWMRHLLPVEHAQVKALKRQAAKRCMGSACAPDHRGKYYLFCGHNGYVCKRAVRCAAAEDGTRHYLCRRCKGTPCARCAKPMCQACATPQYEMFQAPRVCGLCARAVRRERAEAEAAAERARVDALVEERLRKRAASPSGDRPPKRPSP